MEISCGLTTFFKANHLVILQNQKIKRKRDGCFSSYSSSSSKSNGTRLLCRPPPLPTSTAHTLKLLLACLALPEPRRRLLLQPPWPPRKGRDALQLHSTDTRSSSSTWRQRRRRPAARPRRMATGALDLEVHHARSVRRRILGGTATGGQRWQRWTRVPCCQCGKYSRH
jgi:hypothetical protein